MGRVYNRAAWHKARKRQLQRQPLCEQCLAKLRVVPAVAVHHRTPIADDPTKAFDESNFESLCAAHHNEAHNRGIARDYSDELDPATGVPRDGRHPFNTRRA
jgi:5-methylcytosine-specific restriction endonuclease McrA